MKEKQRSCVWEVGGCRWLSHVLHTNNGSKGFLQRKRKYVKGCEFPDLLEIVDARFQALLPGRSSLKTPTLSLLPVFGWWLLVLIKLDFGKGRGFFRFSCQHETLVSQWLRLCEAFVGSLPTDRRKCYQEALFLYKRQDAQHCAKCLWVSYPI